MSGDHRCSHNPIAFRLLQKKNSVYNYRPYWRHNWSCGHNICNQLLAAASSGIVLGFFLLSSGPIGFQYGAEITYPASEGTSNGMLILMGQISGIAFIFGMDSLKSSFTGSMTRSLIMLIGLMALSILISLRLKESTILSKEEDQ